MRLHEALSTELTLMRFDYVFARDGHVNLDDAADEHWGVRLPDGRITKSYIVAIVYTNPKPSLFENVKESKFDDFHPPEQPMKLSEALAKYPLVLTASRSGDESWWIPLPDGGAFTGFVGSLGGEAFRFYKGGIELDEPNEEVIDYLEESKLSRETFNAYIKATSGIPEPYKTSFHKESELKVSTNQLHNTCSCESLLNGHVNGCGYKAGKKK